MLRRGRVPVLTCIPKRVYRKSTVKSSLVIAAMLLFCTIPLVTAFPYDPYQHAQLAKVTSWRDPGGNGADLVLNPSPDGTRLLLFGYGAPGEIRITDLDTGNATVLDPPGPDFLAGGCDWSMSGDRIVVWGDVGGERRIVEYDVDTASLIGSVAWLDLIELAEVTEVTYLADDVIIAVAGRDSNGTSRLIFIEPTITSLRWNHEWEGNGTILAVIDNGEETLIFDSTETLTVLRGYEWNAFTRFPDAFIGGLSSWSISGNMPWIAGDRGGRVVTADYPTDAPFINIKVGEDPILGVSWTPVRISNLVVATGIPGGGSRLAAWQIRSNPPYDKDVYEMCSLEIAERVTMISPYPGSDNTVYVAADDGSLHLVRYDVRPMPTYIREGDPDQVDGRGIEPFHQWYPGGDSQYHRFYFNHRGSLFALRGFGAAGDLRVVDRAFNTVAELSVPWTASNFLGLGWSHGDRWLVIWGNSGSSKDPKMALKAYDAPDFEPSTTFPSNEILAKVSGIFSMEFLPGDKILAMACSEWEVGPQLLFIDLQTGEVVDQIPLPAGGSMWELRSDGVDQLMLFDGMNMWTIGLATREFKREGIDTGLNVIAWDTNSSFGWSFVGVGHNVSVWNGTPREQEIIWDVWPNKPMGMVWANGQEGDLVLGSIRFAPGTSIQLWRREPNPDGSWRDLDGYTLVSELNTSRILLQLEADPAYEGMVMASFNDGTICLYHLNVTPYPPTPEELGNLSTEPIYPLDDGNGGDGSDLPWGSTNDWLFPVILIMTIAGLVAVLVILRYKERRSRD